VNNQAKKKTLSHLKKLFPKAGMMLRYDNPWELLVAVQLSAQCTDARVNIVTEKLFKKYRTLEDYVKASPREFEGDIFQTGFYKNKTKNILSAAKIVKEQFHGKLGNAYCIAEGIAVDTHVMRLAQVLGLSKHKTPEKIEQDLMKLISQKDWFRTTYMLIDYGRAYCTARPHNHAKCPLGGTLIGYAREGRRGYPQKTRRAS
jgi:endonuclease-3